MSHMSQIRKLLLLLCLVSCTRVLVVQNPLPMDRNAEIVEIDAPKGQFRILSADGKEVPYQITYTGKLIFPASVPASGTVRYRIVKGKPSPVDTVVCGSMRPERMDDIIWENQYAGWRMYGPGTRSSGAAVYGYDVFTKSVPYPVMDRRFQMDHDPESWRRIDEWRSQGLTARADSLLQAISYHVDHGDGMDVYAVGATLGCGTAALQGEDGSIIFPGCWESYEILDNGPLRFTVRVVMDGGAETRLITCDAGAWLNKVEIQYDAPEDSPLVAGIVIHSSNPEAYASGAGWIAFADLGDSHPGPNGEIYCGAVIPKASGVSVEQGHILLHSVWKPGFTYYFGSGWSKAGIVSLQEWGDILAAQEEKILNPLVAARAWAH